MLKEKKTEIIEELRQDLAGSSIGILADFRGFSAADMVALRRKLRPQGIKVKVVKNTLTRLALKEAGKESLAGLFKGQVALAFGPGDATAVARGLVDYLAANKVSLTVKAAFLGDRALTAPEVTRLARLPSREVLIAQVMAGMQSPLYRLVGVLASPLRGVMGVLQARIKQLEESQPAAPAPEAAPAAPVEPATPAA